MIYNPCKRYKQRPALEGGTGPKCAAGEGGQKEA